MLFAVIGLYTGLQHCVCDDSASAYRRQKEATFEMFQTLQQAWHFIATVVLDGPLSREFARVMVRVQ
jgi:hypothetical protein